MLLMQWAHIIGFAMFFGGGTAAMILGRLASRGGPTEGRNIIAAEMVVGRFASVGLLLLFASGITAIFLGGFAKVFGHEVWLHVMIALAIVAAAVDGIATGSAKKQLKAMDASDATAAERFGHRVWVLRVIWLIAVVGASVMGVWRITA